VLKELVVLLDLNCDFVRPAAHVFLIHLGVTSIGMQ